MSRKQYGPRVRALDNRSGNGIYTHVNENGVSVYTHVQSPMTFSSDRMADVVVENYFTRSAAGEVFNNPMSRTRSIQSCGGGLYFARNIANPSETYTGSGGSVTLANVPFSNIDRTTNYNDQVSGVLEQLKLEALSKIDSTPFNFMEDAAEIASTMRYLKDPLSALADLSRTFERDYKVRRKKGWPHAKALADAWLTSRYAVRPLMISIDNGYQALFKGKLVKSEERRTARTFAVFKADSSGIHSTPGPVALNFDWSRQEDGHIRVGILYSVTNPARTALQSAGFRQRNIPVTAWQLLPYSWVVDRIVNLTQVLQALTNLADPGVQIIAAWVTERKNSIDKTQYISQDNPGWNVSVQGDILVQINESITRTPWIPTVGDAQPVVNLRIDTSFVLDLASLALQRLRLGSFDSR